MWQLSCHIFWCKLTLNLLPNHLENNIYSSDRCYRCLKILPIIAIAILRISTIEQNIAIKAIESLRQINGSSASTKFGVKLHHFYSVRPQLKRYTNYSIRNQYQISIVCLLGTASLASYNLKLINKRIES